MQPVVTKCYDGLFSWPASGEWLGATQGRIPAALPETGLREDRGSLRASAAELPLATFQTAFRRHARLRDASPTLSCSNPFTKGTFLSVRKRGHFYLCTTREQPPIADTRIDHYTTRFHPRPSPPTPRPSPMSDPYFQQLFAQRIGGANDGKRAEIYKFEKIKRAKRKVVAEHPERKLLDFGIGENDEMAAASIRRVLAEEADKPENRGYADNGILAFKEAVARPMRREFGVELDPATEINHCIGTKSMLAMLPAALDRPRRVTLMTVPGYPVAGNHTRFYGGEVYRLPLLGPRPISCPSWTRFPPRFAAGRSFWC